MTYLTKEEADNLIQKKTAVYIDDMRTPTKTLPGFEPWVIVRSYEEFTEYILRNGIPDFVSFDHDLADEHIVDHAYQVSRMGWQSPDYQTYREKTGLECARFLCDYILDNKCTHFPGCSVHSHNPVGALNIQSYINGFKKHVGLIPDCWIGQHEFVIEEPTK